MIIQHQLTPAVPLNTPMLLPQPRQGRAPGAAAQIVFVFLLALTLVTGLVGASMWRSGGPAPPLSHLAAPNSQPLLAASPTALPQNATVLAEFVTEIALDANPMTSLEGVAVDEDGMLYVIDAFQDQIQRFDGDGRPLGAWGETGTGPGQFRFHDGGAGLGDLAIGPNGNLYVADPFNNRIQILAPDGTVVLEWGDAGSGEGQFAEPEGITVDGAGNVYVADTDNGRVQVFDPEGQFLASWAPPEGEGGSRPLPGDVAVAAEGMVSVTDARTRRVIRFDADGTVVGAFGGESGELDALVLPSGVASDAQGNLFVADEGGNRVQVFAPDGTLLGTIGSAGVHPGQFITPVNLALGPDRLLYVSDGGNRRIQVFRVLQ